MTMSPGERVALRAVLAPGLGVNPGAPWARAGAGVVRVAPGAPAAGAARGGAGAKAAACESALSLVLPGVAGRPAGRDILTGGGATALSGGGGGAAVLGTGAGGAATDAVRCEGGAAGRLGERASSAECHSSGLSCIATSVSELCSPSAASPWPFRAGL